MIETAISYLATLSLAEGATILVGGAIALYVVAMRVIAAVKRIVVRFVIRHTALAGLGILGLSFEAFLPDGILGTARRLLSAVGLG